jgi:prevent-host-death family protein
MNTVGIFEAKTKFTSLCEDVVKSGLPVMVSKRGRPIVLVTPVPAELQTDRPDILNAWQKWHSHAKNPQDEFPEVWKLRSRAKPSPLDQ